MRHLKRHNGGLFAVAIAALVALGSLTDSGPFLLGNGTAEAVIGRPLTPMSYAGVARRTTRRAAYAGAYAGAASVPVASSTTVVTSVPSGCTQVASGGTTVYQCGGGQQYTPAYNGTTVVYRSN
jgi:hypothetical protein